MIPFKPTDKEREACQIAAAHPMCSGEHDLYNKAMRLVGERHAKGDLVDLVTMLLLKIHRAESVLGEIRDLGCHHGDESCPYCIHIRAAVVNTLEKIQ